VAAAAVELQPEPAEGAAISGKTDASGNFQFSGLRAGKYALRVFSPGFLRLRVRFIEVKAGERMSLPDLVLGVWLIDCSEIWARMEYARMTETGARVGSLVGTVSLPDGGKAKRRPAVGARVTLECPGGEACGATTLDSQGGFRFQGLAEGDYALTLEHAGYQREVLYRFQVLAGMETVYGDIALQRCRGKSCGDPTKSKRRQAICE